MFEKRADVFRHAVSPAPLGTGTAVSLIRCRRYGSWGYAKSGFNGLKFNGQILPAWPASTISTPDRSFHEVNRTGKTSTTTPCSEVVAGKHGFPAVHKINHLTRSILAVPPCAAGISDRVASSLVARKRVPKKSMSCRSPLAGDWTYSAVP